MSQTEFLRVDKYRMPKYWVLRLNLDILSVQHNSRITMQFRNLWFSPTKLKLSIVIKIYDIISPGYLVSSDAFCFYAGTRQNSITPQNPVVNSG